MPKRDKAIAVNQGRDGDERSQTDETEQPPEASEASETSALAVWERELSLLAEAGREVLIELHEASGQSQDRAAEVIRSLIPTRVKRGMTGATLSRYSSDAEHFWHVPFLVLLSMLRAYRIGLRDYVERVFERALILRYGDGDASALGSQLATETDMARLRERSEQGREVLDAWRLLTPGQRNDKLIELKTLAARNQEYRAETITGGYPTASDSDVEVGGGLMAALNETDTWAERLRQSRRSKDKGGNSAG